MNRRRSRSRSNPMQPESSPAQRSLLADFWTDDEENSDQVEDTDENKEEQRFHNFFSHSVFNPKTELREAQGSVSRRLQVGLYPADAELLEELFLQSKAAGLKNVSRARILRVALRHFHTCWLNADI